MNSHFSENSTVHRPWIILTVMLVAILEVLDSTIVNVALPNMKASFSVNNDQITWVLTSYIVASAVMIPLTGLLSSRLGKRKFMQITITGFMVSSFLCGITQGIHQMIVLRVLQGLSGASLIPLSQSIMREVFSKQEQPKAMAIWGLGVMTAPVMGPTIGGYIVSWSTWRWIFYINMPICLLSLLLCYFFIPQSKTQKRPIDMFSLIYMVLGIGCLQLFLDQGQSRSWFDSYLICFLLGLSVIGLLAFIYRTFQKKLTPLVKLQLLSYRNFSLCSLMLLCFCGCIFATLAIQPIMLSSLFGYPADATGLIMAPRGLASGFAMALSPLMLRWISPRAQIALGLILCAIGAFLMSQWSLQANTWSLVTPGLWQGLGMGFFMIPVSTMALNDLPSSETTEGAGLFSYSRMLGTSIGISLLSTYISRQGQKHWHHLSQFITPYSTHLQSFLAPLHLAPHTPQAMNQISQVVMQQSTFQAYINAYQLIAILLMIIIPFSFLIQQPLEKSP